MPERIGQLALRAIEQKVFPGCVVGFVETYAKPTILPFGSLAYAKGEDVTEHTVYDVASVTKSIPLASIVLHYIEEGKLEFSDLVRTHIPELRNDHAATIEDLLRYRVRGEAMSSLAHLSAKEIMQRIFETGFTGLPGEPRYSNLPAFLLGIILERITGKTLGVQADDIFFSPLGMLRTSFLPRYPADDIAPTEMEDGTEIRGIVHDESARVFARENKAVGHAGLFSTAGDLLLFLQALLEGKYPEVTRGAHQGLGWQLNQKFFMGSRFGPRTFGKTGFTGTSVVCDTDRGKAVVILSNRTYPKRPDDAQSLDSAINHFRAAIANIVFESSR